MSKELGKQLVRKNQLELEFRKALRELDVYKMREIQKFLSERQERNDRTASN